MEFDTNRIDELRALMDEKMKELQETGKNAFKECVKVFFQACPEVQAVVWSQYTPYFNDGDECTFGVNEVTFVLQNFDRDDLLNPYEYEDDEYGVGSYDTSGKYKPEYRKLSSFINANEDIMKSCFGDHTSVYVTPTEIITEEYDHD